MNTSTDKLQTAEKHKVPAEIESTKPGVTFTPAVDIFEEASSITLTADMPGVEAGDLEIDLRDGVLTLRAGVDSPEKEGEKAEWRIMAPGTNRDRPWLLEFDKAPSLAGQNRVAYLRTKVWSPKQQKAQFEMGTVEGIDL